MCPTYCFECECGGKREVIKPVSSRNDVQYCACGNKMTRVITPAYSMPDIKPYRSVAGDLAGQEVSGRKAHREFLKRNHLIEVGDQPMRDTRKLRPIHRKGEIAEELKRVIPEVLRRGR